MQLVEGETLTARSGRQHAGENLRDYRSEHSGDAKSVLLTHLHKLLRFLHWQWPEHQGIWLVYQEPAGLRPFQMRII